ALLVHHVVVLEEMLADLEVACLPPLLRGADGAGHHGVLDGLTLLHTEPVHDALDALGAEDAEEIALEGGVEARGARVALPTGAAAQLVVDAALLVALGPQDVQAAQGHHPLVLRLGDLAGLLPG